MDDLESGRLKAPKFDPQMLRRPIALYTAMVLALFSELSLSCRSRYRVCSFSRHLSDILEIDCSIMAISDVIKKCLKVGLEMFDA